MSNECNEGNCRMTRDGKNHSHEIKDSKDDFTEYMIPIFQGRIDQELGNISSAEIKASILIATCVAVVGILFIRPDFINLQILQASIFSKIFNIMFILIPFSAAFFLGLRVVIPKRGLKLLAPLRFNNLYGKESIEESRKILKKSLIVSFEFIQNNRLREMTYLKIGYTLLSIGFIALIVILFVKQMIL